MSVRRIDKKVVMENLPFLLVGAVALLWHLVLKISAGDDVVYFQTLMDGRSIWEILVHRYQTWSSRMAIEFVLIPLVNYPLLWKILDVLVFSTIPVWMYHILSDIPANAGISQRDKKQSLRLKWLVCGFTLLYPFSDMVSAGWIATTTNYLWPLWCAFLLVFLLKKMIYRQKLHWYTALAGVLVCIYGSSQEQVAAILLVIFILAVVCFWRRKHFFCPLLYVFLGITAVSLITILRCPGNVIRSAQEIEARMPEFAELSFLEKVYMGAANVERIFIAGVNSIFLVVVLVLAALVYIKTKDYWKTLISGIPALLLMGYGVIRTGHPWFEKIFVIPEQTAEWNFASPVTYLPILFLMVAAGSILYALFLLLQDQVELYAAVVFLLGAGLASGIVMGFSPTIYASANRPYMYLYFILMMTALYCQNKLHRIYHNAFSGTAQRLVITVFGLFVLVNVAEVFWMCHIM